MASMALRDWLSIRTGVSSLASCVSGISIPAIISAAGALMMEAMRIWPMASGTTEPMRLA